jgi:hypothetical protein
MFDDPTLFVGMACQAVTDSPHSVFSDKSSESWLPAEEDKSFA